MTGVQVVVPDLGLVDARTLVATNPHSLQKYRVNNVVANMPEFSQAFGCKKGTPMYPEKSCRVW